MYSDGMTIQNCRRSWWYSLQSIVLLSHHLIDLLKQSNVPAYSRVQVKKIGKDITYVAD